MKSFTLICIPFGLLLALSSLVQSLSLTEALTELPECSLGCLLESVANSTCTATNSTCQCANKQLQNQVTLCVQDACTVEQALVTKNITQTVCDQPIRDKSGLYANISIVFGVLSAFFVLLRIFYKIVFTTTDLGVDDYLIFLTLLSGVPSSVINVRYLAANGLGRDIWTLTPSNIANFGHAFYVNEILYFLQVALLKLSLLFFYKRIFPASNVQLIIWATITFDIIYGAVFLFLAIFQCRPVNYFWHKWDGEHEGTCIDSNGIAWSNAAISIALDAWMLAIPLWQLSKLKMHWKNKVGVALMFCVGTFITVVSIIRLSSLVHFGNSSNPTYDEWSVSNWSTIEINIGIICTCMPVIRLIAVHFFPTIMGTRSHEYRSHYYQSGYSKNHGGSRSFGREGPPLTLDNQKIMRSTSCTVNYTDCDETRLVPLQEMEPPNLPR